MISIDEKNSFIAGYKNISDGIDTILSLLDVFKKNKELIYNIVQSRFNIDNAVFPYQDFIDLESSLYELKNYFNSHPVFEEEYVTEQYKAFMKAEVVSFVPENFAYLQSHTVDLVIKYIREAGNLDFIAAKSENGVISSIYNIPRHYIQHYRKIEDIRAKLHIFYQIRSIDGSIVMIGANGSGKSSLARHLNNKLSSNIAILSAQRFLYYQKKKSISTEGNEIDRVRAFQLVSKSAQDQNIQQLITTDMNLLMDALLSQHIDCTVDYYVREKDKQRSVLSRTIDIWNKIIEHREIYAERTGVYVKGKGIAEYDFNLLSDGEKAIFYYIGHILFAREKSYIIVDEPENHLNLTVCNKLWDELEKERSDCRFIYLTHNLSFATSRSNSTILWNKKFTPPYNWDFEILPQNSTIPPRLMMEIVGSRKDIMFCEGHDTGSMDYMLYSILFPQYTVIPVAGHRNVISYVNAYNSSSYFPNHAVGIIDGDHHLPEQIEKWKSQAIYTIPVNEIENIICDKDILEKAVDNFCSPEEALEKYYERFWKILEETKEQQATNYIAEYINNSFNENFLHETKEIDVLIREAHSLLETTAIKKRYTEILERIDDVISSKDYSAALRFVNFKKRLTNDIAKVIVDHYENRILDLIKKDNKLQEHIRATYFPDCPF